MSDTELHSGKLRLLEKIEGESLEQQCRRLWIENGKNDEEFDFDEFFYDMNRKYVKLKEQVWELFDHNKMDSGDSFCKMTPSPDGSYSFITSFYNGGTYLEEMLEDALEEVLNKSK